MSKGQVSYATIYDEIERKQLARREITITGAIDSDVSHVISVKLRYLAEQSRKPVTIYLNTPGGSVVDGLAIYDAIKSAVEGGMKVSIIATGACMSMGSIILQAATKRLSTRHTSFLLHELSMVNIGALGQLQDKHEEAKRLQNTLNSIITERSGLDKKKLKELVERRDLYLTAEEALKWKLIDGIV